MSFFNRRKISIDLSRKKSSLSLSSLHKNLQNPFFLLVAIIALFFAYHYFRKYTELRDVVAHVTQQETNPATTVISAVDKHILLPANEQPVLAQVSDTRALAGNKFFRNALVGDDVLVYCRSELSILYSPSRDKIIEVLPQALSEACHVNR